jgi:catechol 2,3-dioxygenase-like lactoylglutathione lyase family enzyme
MSLSHIDEVTNVYVPVSDQDAARAFFVDSLGFELRVDFRYAGDEHWVEVAPPGAPTRVALVPPSDARPLGIETGVGFASRDVDADHAAFRQRGVEVDDILREGDPPVRWSGALLAGIPAMFLLRDPDGNSFVVVQAADQA